MKWAADGGKKHDKRRQLLTEKGQIGQKKTCSKEKGNGNCLQDQIGTAGKNIERQKKSMDYDETG